MGACQMDSSLMKNLQSGSIFSTTLSLKKKYVILLTGSSKLSPNKKDDSFSRRWNIWQNYINTFDSFFWRKKMTQTKDFTSDILSRLLSSIVEELRNHGLLVLNDCEGQEVVDSCVHSEHLMCGVGTDFPKQSLMDGSIPDGELKMATDHIVRAILAQATHTAEKNHASLVHISNVHYLTIQTDEHIKFGIEYQQKVIV